LLLVIGSVLTLTASLVVLPSLVSLGGKGLRSPAAERDPESVLANAPAGWSGAQRRDRRERGLPARG
jgi:hypothetical protein